MGLLEVCVCLAGHLEVHRNLPPSHTRARHVEQEGASILQALNRPHMLHMAALHSSAFWGGSREMITFLERKMSHLSSLILRKGLLKYKHVFCALNFRISLV